jgi:hypothetical protein
MVFSAKNKIIFDDISLRTLKLILSIFAGLIELVAEIYIALFSMARKAVENNIDLFSAAFPPATENNGFPGLLNALIFNL